MKTSNVKNPAIEYENPHTLVCDNPNCDFEHKLLENETHSLYINMPCPECGENLLTQEDHDRFEAMIKLIDKINRLPEWMKWLIRGGRTYKQLKAAAERNPEKYSGAVKTHKEIKIIPNKSK